MTIAYFDCFSGAGGDMIVGALLDAGADAAQWQQQIAALGVSGYALTIEKTNKQGFAATRFGVRLDVDSPQPHRHLRHIRDILNASTLPQPVRDQALQVFTRLAEAEAQVHGTTPEKVHFHEVGAVDAIVDVVGAVLALRLLGVTEVLCGPVPVGSGTVKCDHGIMPVPAPATANLLRGVPIRPSEETGELTTPTAAAIFTTLARGFCDMPPMRISRVGYGAGTRDGRHVPNVLRVFVGERATPGTEDTEGAGGTEGTEGTEGMVDQVTVLETNLDDASPQIIGYCMERLLAEGALDAYAVPILMKKSRPGVVLTVLCPPDRTDALQRVIFEETPTLGIRRHGATRAKMSRRHQTVSTKYGDIRIKVGVREQLVTAHPEYEDCRAAAAAHGVPLHLVRSAAEQEWSRLGGNSAG